MSRPPTLARDLAGAGQVVDASEAGETFATVLRVRSSPAGLWSLPLTVWRKRFSKIVRGISNAEGLPRLLPLPVLMQCVATCKERSVSGVPSWCGNKHNHHLKMLVQPRERS